MKTTLLLATLMVALTTSFAAVAADTPAKDPAVSTSEQPAKAEPAKTQPAKKNVKPHSHAEAKGNTGMPQPTEATGPAAKPLHDHQKFHKQM
ncbi:MAG: hypothetical protein WCV99_12695 [Sterolibacterium sp.]|jgi:hypothetical protein